MKEVHFTGEFIKLGQALKLAGLVYNGAESKIEIQSGNVKLNGEVDTRRGAKLYGGEVVEFNGSVFKVIRDED